MAEVIIGVGRNKPIPEIARLAESEIRISQGPPKRLRVFAPNMEILAEREDFDGPFTRYVIRIRATDGEIKKLDEFVGRHGKDCSASRDDDWFVLEHECHVDEEADQKALFKELNTCVKVPEIWRVAGDGFNLDPISPELIFQALVRYKASDAHLCADEFPVFRVDNETRGSELIGKLSGLQIRAFIHEIAPAKDWKEFEDSMQCSFNYHQVGLGYARVSAFMKDGAPHCTMRFLPEVIPSFDDLQIPKDTMVALAKLHHGLVLITGMTGSGKSTTAAALVDWINSNKSVHILCIENPVEYVHHNKRSIVSQRNTGTDVRTFSDGVTGALRHDPDVIVIGEMRDPDTIRSAISAAATGHLVISTLHSNTASEVVNRIVSFFDPVERDLVKLQLRDCLRCVMCQRLLPKKGGGRLPAIEVLFNDIKAINDCIVTGDTDGIRIGMQQTVSHSFLFEDYLFRMYKAGEIELETARFYATESSILDQMVMGTYSVPRLEAIKALRGQAGKSDK